MHGLLEAPEPGAWAPGKGACDAGAAAWLFFGELLEVFLGVKRG